MRFVIPKRVQLPGGYWAEVKQVSHREFKRLTEEGDKAMYKYDIVDQPNAIYLDRSRTPAQRRADFCHEYLHAALDWQVKSLGRQDVDAKL